MSAAELTHFGTKERQALCGAADAVRLSGCIDGVLCAACLLKLGRLSQNFSSNAFLYCAACDKIVLLVVKAAALCCHRCRAVLLEPPDVEQTEITC